MKPIFNTDIQFLQHFTEYNPINIANATYVWQMLLKTAVILCMFPLAVSSQPASNNILLVKKGIKTVGKYFTGSHIAFTTTDGMPIMGQIERLENDSIFLVQYQIRRIQRPDGAVLFDTTGKFRLMFSIANIGSFPVGRQRGKNIVTNGTLLTLGGTGYLALNLVNTVRDGDAPLGKDNRTNVLGALGAVGTGILLGKAWPKKFFINNKYRIKILYSNTLIAPTEVQGN